MKNFTQFQEESNPTPAKIDLLIKKLDTQFSGEKFGYTKGKKYNKVYRVTGGGDGKSAWAFIDNEGNMFKAAGWKAPAKGSRGHIDDVLARKFSDMEAFSFGSLR